MPGAVDTFAGGAGATVSVVVGATDDVPGVIVADVSVVVVVVLVTPVELWAVSVLTTSRRPQAAARTSARIAIHFMLPSFSTNPARVASCRILSIVPS